MSLELGKRTALRDEQLAQCKRVRTELEKRLTASAVSHEQVVNLAAILLDVIATERELVED